MAAATSWKWNGAGTSSGSQTACRNPESDLAGFGSGSQLFHSIQQPSCVHRGLGRSKLGAILEWQASRFDPMGQVQGLWTLEKLASGKFLPGWSRISFPVAPLV